MFVDIHNTTNKYNIIFADPPWQYSNKGNEGTCSTHYSTMSLTEICQLPVKNITADDCALFLWCTGPFLNKADQVMNAWGFTYKTVYTNWVKTTKDGSRPTGKAVGYYTRNPVEYLLVGVKGNMNQHRDKHYYACSVHQEYSAKHSQKPLAPMNVAIKMYGDKPRIELFARDAKDGWHYWGNEVK